MTLTILLSLLLGLGAHADNAPRAFYEVPVAKGLAPYARYEIREYGKAIRGDTVDLSAVAKVLRAQKLSPEAVDGKMRVAALFREGGGDIGGIITYVGLGASGF